MPILQAGNSTQVNRSGQVVQSGQQPCIGASRPSCNRLVIPLLIDAAPADMLVISNNHNTAVSHLGGGLYRALKTSGATDWDGDAISTVGFTSSFVLQISDPTHGVANLEVGVSDDAVTGANFTDVDYGWHFAGAGTATPGATSTRANGVSRTGDYSEATGYYYFIQRIGSTLYWKQGSSLTQAVTRDTQTGVTGTLYVDSSIFDVGGAFDALAYATGDMAGASSLTFAASATATGTGALSGTSALTFAPSATATGLGALSGTSTLTFSPSSTLTGKGALSGTASLIFSPSATLTGKGALSGSSTLTFAPSGVIAGLAPITGSSTLVFAVSGTATGTGALSGASALTFTPAGLISGLAPISGSSSLSFTASATITGAGALSGVSGLTLSSTGTLTALGALSGVASITFAAAGTLVGIVVIVPLAPRKFTIRLGDEGQASGSRRAYASGGQRSYSSSGSRSSRNASGRSYSSSRGR